jgi:serine/threonine-protein kinase HipA
LTLDRKQLKTLAEQFINKRIAVTGVQPKISLTIEHAGKKDARLTIVGLWGDYIVKPQHPDIPYMPETEDLTMHLAALFEIEVCEHMLLLTKEGSLVYIAKRFDRSKYGKIHMEDFCQLSEFLTEQKYKGSYEQAGKLILKHCTNSGYDTLRYFELLLFCFLTGNNDMHLKNFSLLEKEAEILMSPAYDLINVNLVHPADKEDLALMLAGKRKKIRLRDFEALGELLKIPVKVRHNVYKKFQTGDDRVQEMIMSSFLPEEYKEQYWNIWLKKKKQLQWG